jgi:uncharacterized protein YidB (DUF937 family)
MGLLDDVMGAVGGQRGGSPLLSLAMQLINGGGLNGLLDQFKAGGLGQIADSWVSTGQNLPVSPQQISQVLGAPQLQQLASQFGLSADALPQQLAGLLPQVVDKLTPTGQVPSQLPDLGGLDDLLKSFLR